MREYFVVERMEGDYAVCEKEDRTHIDISICKLYPNVKVGDWFYFENGKYIVDKEKTQEAKAKNIQLQNLLFED